MKSIKEKFGEIVFLISAIMSIILIILITFLFLNQELILLINMDF